MFSLRPTGKEGAHESANTTEEAVMKRSVYPFVLVILAFVAAFVQGGCGQESSSAEREERREPSAERGREQGSPQGAEPKHIGDAVEVGPLLVTLNDAKPYSSGGQGAASQSHYYAVVDLTLENQAQTSFDASDVDYLLRNEQGYSFERKSVPDQKPPPEGQVMPGGKASGQVAFDLGTEPVQGPLTLFVSLPDVEGASQGVFEFEVKHDTVKKPPPDTSAETKSATGPDYDLVEDPAGGLTVEVPPSWGVETGEESEKAGTGLNTWSYHAGEYIISSITTAPDLDAWYTTGASGAYMVASKALAQYSDYELTHSMLFANRAENCATTGPYEDYNRSPYSGKIQTWYDCGPDGATTYAVTVAPGGRECVAVFDMRVSDEVHREAVEHILDSFEVDCQNVASEPLATPSTSAPSGATSSPEASATATPEPPEPEAGTKHVEVVVSSDVPVDVSITDDNFDVSIAEEITGTKTYEFDIAADSGLMVSAINMDMRGNVSIEVYENGQLKTQDTDSSGYAQVMY